MKAVSAFLLATLSNCYQLQAWSDSISLGLGPITLSLDMSTEAWIGTRAPALWGEYQDFHEGAAYIYEVYSDAYFHLSPKIQIGDLMFGITLDFTFWDIAFFENLWMYFPGRAEARAELEAEGKEVEDDKPDWCNYQGWY